MVRILNSDWLEGMQLNSL